MASRWLTAFGLGLAASAWAAAASASVAVWSTAERIAVAPFGDNPLVIFGFNPQPEPPADFLRDSQSTPTSLTQTIVGVEDGQQFQLLFGVVVPGGDAGLIDPEIGSAFGAVSLDFDIGFDTLTAQLTFESASGGQGIGAVSFNPQPEPPAYLGDVDVLGLDFGFTSYSDVSVTLSVFNSDGAALALRELGPVGEVPLPAGGLLLTGALGALALVRRRIG